MDTPLIWTVRGNVPVESLDYNCEWTDGIITDITLKFEDGNIIPVIEKKGYMKLVERYRFKDTGEVAKENAHICMMDGNKLSPEQGNFG